MNMKFVKLFSILLLVFVFCGCVAAADIEVSDCDASAVPDSVTTISVHDNDDGTKSLTISNNQNNSNNNLNGKISSVGDGEGTPVPHAHVYVGSDMNETPHDQFVNESFTFNIDFSNVGDAVGYQPIIELIVPKELSINDHSFLGTNITMTRMGSFTLNNLYTVKDNFTNKTITLNESYENATLYVIHLPLGSYTPDEPATTVRMGAYLNGDIPLDLINLLVTPIFRFGDAYIDDPVKHPAIYGDTITAYVQPEIVRATKTDGSPEVERTTGPNFNYTYTVNVDIANGKDINNLIISDNIPTQLVYAGDLHVYYRGVELIENQDYKILRSPSADKTGGNLTIEFIGNFTGTEGVGEVTLNYVVWAPRFDNSTDENQYILNPGTGGWNITNNIVEVTCDYNSSYGNYSFDINASDNVTLKPLAIQKDVLVNGGSVAGGTVSVGDILTYVINFQVSDYFSLTDFVLNDTPLHPGLGAGQQFIEDSVYITLMGTTYEVPSRYYIVSPEKISEGGVFTYFRVLVNVSAFLSDHGIAHNLTGSLNISDTLDAAVVGNISFDVKVTAFYENGTNGTSVSSQDIIMNSVTLESKLTSNNHVVNDTSFTSCVIRPPSISKSIIAVNGNTSRNSSDINNKVRVNPGDNVTFLIDAYIVNSVDGFTLSDFLPTPLFNITSFASNRSESGLIPSVNHWAYTIDGEIPHDKQGMSIEPEVIVSPDPNNELYFRYGNIFDEDNMFHLKIMITVEASNAQFADELYLTNLVGIQYQDSLNQTYHNETIVGFILNEPELTINKTVELLENLYDDGGFQGGSIANYTVNVTNIGHFNACNVTVCDDFLELGAGEVINLTFIYGNGTVVNLTQDEINDFFNTSKGYHVGNLPWKGEKGTDCNNFVIIYTVKFNEKTQPKGRLINTANITKFASIIDGPNFATNKEKYSDNETVVAAGVKMNKTFLGSEDYGPDFELSIEEFGRKQNLTVGELGVFNLTITIPNLNFTSLTIFDVIEDYLEIPTVDSKPMVYLVCSDNETNTHFDGDYTLNWQRNSHLLTIDCGKGIFVPVNGSNVTHTITFLIYYVVVDEEGISRDITHENVVNTANFTLHTGYTWFNETDNTTYELVEYIVAKDDVDVYQPKLEISKNYDTTIVAPGDEVSFNITVNNTGESPSFNTTIVDDLSILIGNFTVDGKEGLDWTFSGNSSEVEVTWNGDVVSFNFHRINPGESISIRGNFIVKDEVVIGMEGLNVGIVNGNSTPENRHSQTRVYTVADNDTITTKNLTINKTVLNSTIANGKTNVTIGENVTYNMTITVVEGYYPYLKFNDTLPTGFRYVNDSVVIICNGTHLTNINPNNGTIWYNITISDEGKVIVIDFNNDFAQYIVKNGGLFNVYLNATVLNVTSNNASAKNRTKTNFVEFHWYQHVKNDTANVTIIEPIVNITKNFNATNNISGGDKLYFEIIVNNTGNSFLFNTTIIDDLSELVETFINESTIPESKDYTLEYHILTFYIGQLNPGESKTFKVYFTVRNDVPIGYVYTNLAEITGYSVPVDGTDDLTNRIYAKTDSDSVDTKDLTINKTVYNSTIDNGLTNATIGENVTYEMNVTVVTGNYTNLNVTDHLPDGFKYVDNSVVIKCNDGIIDSTGMYEVTVTDDKVITITFTNDFAQYVIVNGGIFKVYLNATVLNVTSNNASAKNRTKTNLVDLEWNNGHKVNATANVTIVEPKAEIVKEFNVSAMSGGDLISFNITVKNAGDSPLFNVTIVDDLSELVNTLINISDDDFGVYHVVGGRWEPIENPLKDNILSIHLDSLAIGQSELYVVEFHVRKDVPVGYVYTNIANITGYSVNGIITRQYDNTSSSSVDTKNVTINKTVYDSSMPNGKNNVTIGENVTYDIAVTLVNGNYTLLVLNDTLPSVFEYIDNSIVFYDPERVELEVYEGNNYTLTVDSNKRSISIAFTNEFIQYIVNEFDGKFIVSLNATRLNKTNATSNKTNTVNITWNNRSAKAAANVTLVNPAVSINKTFSDDNIYGGEELYFNLTIKNTGYSPLYDIVIEDDLSEFIKKVANASTIRVYYANGTEYGLPTPISESNPILHIDLDFLNNTKNHNSITFRVNFTVLEDIYIGSKFTNVANVSGYSIPSEGVDENHTKRYTAKGNDTVYTEVLPIIKEVINTTIENGPENVTVGENITYKITIQVIEGNYSTLNLTDTLPDGFEYVSDSLLMYIGEELIDNSTGLYSVTINDNKIVIVFTNDFAQKVINSTDTPGNNYFTVYLNATVLDESIINRTSGNKTNLVELRWNDGNYANSTADVTVVEPDVKITKKFNQTTKVEGGDIISFIINATNNGSSPLFNATIVDNLSALISGYIIDGDYKNINITYANGSSVPEGVISWNDDFTIITFNIGTLGYQTTNNSIAFKLTFAVKNKVIIGSKHTNVANVTGYSVPFNGTDDEHNRVYSRIANDSFTTDKPVITKDVAITTAVIGGEVPYVLNVTLPVGFYENLTIVDLLPKGFQYVDGSAIYFNGSVILADMIKYDESTRKITIKFLNINSIDFNNKISINLTVKVLNTNDNKKGNKKVNTVSLYSNGTFCNNATANVTLVEPLISIKKVSNATKFNITETVEYKITIKNIGNAPAYFAVVNDVLNESLIFVNYTSVSGWNISYDNTTRTLSMSGDYLAVNEEVTFVFVCKFADSALGKNIPNNATVTVHSLNDTEGGRTYTNSSNKTIHVIVADVEVTKECKSEVVAGGEEIYYVINVINHGPDTAFNVTLQELFDSSKLYNVSYKFSDDWIPLNFGDIIELGNLANNGAIKINVKGLVMSSATGVLNNTVKVTTDTNESNYDNNNDTNLTNIVAITEIDVLKLANETEVIRGNNISYVITVTIGGPSDAKNVTLRDVFDNNLLLNMEYSLDNVTWSAYTGTISLGNLSAYTTKEVYFRANVNESTHLENITNIVYINTTTNHTGNDNSTNITPIKYVVDLNITKVANVTDVNPGDLVEYIINVTASGISASTNVTLTDVLNTTYLDGSNAKYTVNGIEKGSWTGTVDLGSISPGQSIIVVIYNIKVKNINYTIADRIIPNVANVTSYELNGNYKEDDANITVNLVDVAVEKNMDTGNYMDNVTFTINVTNNGPNSTSNVTVKDLLPSYLIYQNHTASNGNERYNPITGIWTVGDLDVGQIFTLTITCTINKTGFIENNVTVETYTGYDTNMSNNNDTVNDTVRFGIDLAIDKVVDSYGNYTENITYNITVINNGPDNATGVVVIDELPEGIVFISADSADVVDNGDGTFTWTIGNLALGEIKSIKVTCLINTIGNVTNYVNVTGNEYDWNLSNNEDNVTVEIPPAIDLAIVKDVVEFGNYTENITYVINVTNNGPNNASGVVVVDNLPEGIIFLNATEGADIVVNDDGTFTWTIGDLAAGDSMFITVTCLINTTGNVTNFVNVSGNEFEWNWSNNYDNVTVEIPPAADLAVNKTADIRNVTVGDKVVYTIVVWNNGPDTALNAYAIDKLPKGLKFVSYKSSKGSYNPTTGIWTIGDLVVGEKVTLIINTIATKSGVIINVVTVGSDAFDINESNNIANDTIEVKDVQNSNTDSNLISMERTGAPLFALVLVILLFVIGITTRSRWRK